ncbi:GNAT family N-acetyltransferase [Brevibacillus choshinensis]|uniref:GNAT family N-acetyltransferase n=1 Tax=Brevibacillus choshinensis TaxID=54911 RepID=A0ABX7FJT0_BRECH|nr:GNAT family N-acetyltransferase [Brevibacillus choshinensis]QRG65894.1 GNAT family N-acetyltransferase [Brevibacillus choshinensis]
MLIIRNARIEDLPKLAAIEQLCFSKEEAATVEAIEQRIELIPDSFYVAEEDGEIAGFVNGPVIETAFITDDLFHAIKENPATDWHQSILGLAVAPHFQNRGVASRLLTHLEKEARAKKRESITLTCKENLVPFYERHGYVNNGVSSSEHAGATWYNMRKELRS